MDYMTVQEAAKRWGYSEGTIRKWCANGKISVTTTATAEKISGHWRIPSNANCPKPVKKQSEKPNHSFAM